MTAGPSHPRNAGIWLHQRVLRGMLRIPQGHRARHEAKIPRGQGHTSKFRDLDEQNFKQSIQQNGTNLDG